LSLEYLCQQITSFSFLSTFFFQVLFLQPALRYFFGGFGADLARMRGEDLQDDRVGVGWGPGGAAGTAGPSQPLSPQ
jgi:hypothetical protein